MNEGYDKKLRIKQRLFVSAYIKTRNATQAAIEAGYSSSNASRIGAELLGKPQVSLAIKDLLDAQEAASLITTDRIMREYARIAFFDPRNLVGNCSPP